jgi:hypothetical protein
MLYLVVEEIWSTGIEAKLMSASGNALFVGEQEAAEEHAERCTAGYDHHGRENNARYPYWWGRDEGATENHRFVVKPAASSK